MKKEEIKADIVYYTTNFDVLKEVVNKTQEIKNNDLLVSEFIIRLGRYITNKSGLVLVSFGEDKKLNGCMVVSRHIDRIGEYVWIDFAWIDPHCRHLREKYEEELVSNCKIRGIKRIQMRMNRGYRAMKRLSNTYEIGRILEKEVV